MADRITRADVEHVAQLARLALSEDEIVALTDELGAIVDHAAQVSALDTHDVPPTAHPLPRRERVPPRRCAAEPAARRGARGCARRAGRSLPCAAHSG